ncbi:hypothetical protein PPL_08596 [Heterostelium album PN500]|uniref:Uncharacterized protein n=1 Tax=Heterostelium pallidum (strain ATCC 26659 / Pp 5 / PN500) TaxID=670386 RepID=D3BJ71_HETP5|nr:hypothetical protein PPL_08596 [Heterostelium album PN500]EFA77951.1 hypothetical protein PPL_08596 [Heterostelium album PN500]|eukprot:XP_020430079.1 hypothetical protein PPL_08596 [Heterostelium album PN500]
MCPSSAAALVREYAKELTDLEKITYFSKIILIFDQIKEIHKQLGVKAHRYNIYTLWVVENGHIGLFMDRVRKDQIQCYHLFEDPEILMYFCEYVRTLSDFKEVYNKFGKCFTRDSIDCAFIRCEPSIIDYIVDNSHLLPISEKALTYAVSNGHFSAVQRIPVHFSNGYSRLTWARAMLLAAQQNNTELFQYLWNRADRHRFWSAKSVDAFAKHNNQPMIEMMFDEMDRQDELLRQAFLLSSTRKFRPPSRQTCAFAISTSLSLTRYLYEKKQSSGIFDINDYPDDLVIGGNQDRLCTLNTNKLNKNQKAHSSS